MEEGFSFSNSISEDSASNSNITASFDCLEEKGDKRKFQRNHSEVGSIREAFIPLGTFAKCFGLLPTYAFSLKYSSILNKERKWTHFVDYFYTGFLCSAMAAGIVYCTVNPPRLLQNLKGGHDTTDYYVIIFVFYLTAFSGIMSYIVFPRKVAFFHNYLDEFTKIDNLLNFDKTDSEKRCSRIVQCALMLIFFAYLMGGICLFVLDLEEEERLLSDWVMVPITAMTGILLFTPTAFVIFFMNSIKLRMKCYNCKMKSTIVSLETIQRQNNNEDSKNVILPSTVFLLRKEDEMKYFANQLEKMRILREDLRQLVDDTSDIFGGHLLRDYFYSIVGFILYTYFTLFLREDFYAFWFLYPLVDVFILIKVYTLSSSAHYLIQQGDHLRHILRKIPVMGLHFECGLQIQNILKTLDFEVTVSAAGFFSINRNLMTKIVGAITAYFIVLLQFKIC